MQNTSHWPSQHTRKCSGFCSFIAIFTVTFLSFIWFLFKTIFVITLSPVIASAVLSARRGVYFFFAFNAFILTFIQKNGIT